MMFAGVPGGLPWLCVPSQQKDRHLLQARGKA